MILDYLDFLSKNCRFIIARHLSLLSALTFLVLYAGTGMDAAEILKKIETAGFKRYKKISGNINHEEQFNKGIVQNFIKN